MRNSSIYIDDIVEELEEYYECAGFSNIYKTVLAKMIEGELIELYNSTFSDN